MKEKVPISSQVETTIHQPQMVLGEFMESVLRPVADETLVLPEAWQLPDASVVLQAGVNSLYRELQGKFTQGDMDQLGVALQRAHYYHQRSPLERQRTRSDGTEYTTHLVAVTRILNFLQVDSATLTAGILHDTLENTTMPREEVAGFGEAVLLAVESDTKVSEADIRHLYPDGRVTAEEAKAETFKKFIVTLLRDPRGLLVKFADRVHNMATLEHLAKPKREAIALETLRVITPIARATGADQIAQSYTDQSYMTLWSKEYRQAQNLIEKNYAPERLDELVAALRTGTKAIAGLSRPDAVQLKATPPPISAAMKVSEDMITVQDPGYIPVDIDAGNEKDFLRIVKTFNSYLRKGAMVERPDEHCAECSFQMGQQLFHITFFTPEGRLFQKASVFDLHSRVPLRTEFSSRAAYNQALLSRERRQEYARQKLEKPIQLSRQYEDEHNAAAFVESFTQGLQQPLMMVETKHGEPWVIPKNARVIEFAYSIHSSLGMTAIGARINGAQEIVGLDTLLAEGDQVEIVTDMPPRLHVEPSHMDLVRDRHAQQQIRTTLNDLLQVESQYLSNGLESVSQELKKRNLTLDSLLNQCAAIREQALQRGKKKLLHLYGLSRQAPQASGELLPGPKVDLNRAWSSVDGQVRKSYQSSDGFFLACGLDNVADTITSRYVRSLIEYEDTLPKVEIIVPDRLGQSARIQSLIAMFGGNITFPEAVFNQPGLPSGMARLSFQVELPTKKAELGLSHAMALVEQYSNAEKVAPAGIIYQKKKFHLSLPDRNGLSADVCSVIALFADIQEMKVMVEGERANFFCEVACGDEAYDALEHVLTVIKEQRT